jgi:hypothetical protein
MAITFSDISGIAVMAMKINCSDEMSLSPLMFKL